MMNQFQLHDIFATKGLEYLLIIAYLISFIYFWRYLDGRLKRRAAVARDRIRVIDWFRVAEGRYYHPGHAWVLPAGRFSALIGIDDFAHKLIGKVDSMSLPPPGATIRRGEVAWHLNVDEKSIPMVAPVSGKVVEINRSVLAGTQDALDEPYEAGWLLKIRAPRLSRQLKDLLSGSAAYRWMEQTVERLSSVMGSAYAERGLVLQDGGVPLNGFAREIRPGDWDQLVREFLLAEADTNREGDAADLPGA